MHNGSNKIRRIVFWAATVVAIGCLGFAGWYHYSNHRAALLHEKLLEEMAAKEEAARESELALEAEIRKQMEAAAANAPTLEEIEAAEFTGEIDGEAPVLPPDVITDAEENPIDFEVLASYNPELYAWIRIPGTNIDYPIAQHEGEDQTFYLHHDLYGNAQFAGCIYSEAPSAKDFTDPVTVLYGHNMKNGSMFQNIHRFREKEFFEANPYVYIYTPEETLIYQIYAVYAYDDRPIAFSFDFGKEEDLERYLEGTTNPRSMDAMLREDVKVTTSDHILTLSTCITGNPESRLLLQAVLTYES